mmetsp:Transcript_29264/g.39558  ORF Transcript_29264/g.39558 Transcript_29264/m.39558 type:complete len:106 (-) Transcript_29264:78-395(-)
MWGYPDTGNSYYASKLPYDKWYSLNNTYRVQNNFLESITYAILMSIACGIKYPYYTAIAQGCYIVGRFLFTLGYTIAGPNARIPGALLVDVAIFWWVGLLWKTLM